MPEHESSEMPHREILIERARIKNTLRITAIDVETGIEVTFQAPAGTSKRDLDRLAISKVNYVLNKQAKESVEK